MAAHAGKGEPIPEHPYPGQDWKEVRHDNTVTWLAFWKDSISQKDYKYVWLAANSTFKSDSDLAKYEKARKLKVRAPPEPPLPRIVRRVQRLWEGGMCKPLCHPVRVRAQRSLKGSQMHDSGFPGVQSRCGWAALHHYHERACLLADYHRRLL